MSHIIVLYTFASVTFFSIPFEILLNSRLGLPQDGQSIIVLKIMEILIQENFKSGTDLTCLRAIWRLHFKVTKHLYIEYIDCLIPPMYANLLR